MPDLQKIIARYARTVLMPKHQTLGGKILASAGDIPVVETQAVLVEHLPLLLDEVAKAAAAETMEAVAQERRATERLCESCEQRLADLSVRFFVWHEERSHTVSLELCAECREAYWSRLKAIPLPPKELPT